MLSEGPLVKRLLGAMSCQRMCTQLYTRNAPTTSLASKRLCLATVLPGSCQGLARSRHVAIAQLCALSNSRVAYSLRKSDPGYRTGLIRQERNQSPILVGG